MMNCLVLLIQQQEVMELHFNNYIFTNISLDLLKEWKDGLFSVIMRDQAALTGDNPKWIILDGDIDRKKLIHST